MVSAQKIIGQKVISLVSKKYIGNVSGFSVKNGKLFHAFCFNDNDDLELSFPCKNILSFGQDAIILKSEDELSVSENIISTSPLGLPIICQNGKTIGLVKDIEINNNLKIENLVLNNKKIVNSEIDFIDNHFIMLKGKFKLKNKPIVKNNFNYIVGIENNTQIANNLPKITDNTNQIQPSTPTKKVANIPNLIGKTITRDIFYKNKILIKKGTIISQKIIDLALLSGSIKDIMLSCI